MKELIPKASSSPLVVGIPKWMPCEIRNDLLERIQAAEENRLVHRFRFSDGERAVLRHQPPIPVSEWAERHRHVHESSVPGRWSNDTTPYSKGIMDASFFPGVETIAVCKAPQTGISEAIHNCIGYAADRDPGPVLYVYPDELTAKENARDRIIPMFESSPRLKKFFTGKQDDKSNIRIGLSHMRLFMAWSGSVSRLANKPIRFLVLDEIDKYQNPSKEASSEALAEKRITTWRRRNKAKVWKFSSPSDKYSPIVRALNNSQVVFDFHVRCPHCGMEQKMEFERIKYPSEESDWAKIEAQRLAWYECSQCGAVWDDYDRDRAVRLGSWRARSDGLELFDHLRTHRPAKIGFHLPSWLSYFVSMSTVAAAALEYKIAKDAKKPEAKDLLKDLTNAHKAEAWEDYVRDRDESFVLTHCDDRPRGRVPGPDSDGRPLVSALTAGVDTQGTEENGYFRYVIRAFGFGENEESWLVKAGSVPSFEALEKVMFKTTYLDGAGKEHVVRALFQDAMGRRTTPVYRFAVKHRGRVFACQGKQIMAAPLNYSPQEYYPGTQKKRIRGGLQLVQINNFFFKSDLASKLAINPEDPGAFHLHDNTSFGPDQLEEDGRVPGILDEYAREMSVEYFDDEKKVWVQPKDKAQHYWDCEVLALAAAWHLGLREIRQPKSQIKRKVAPAAATRPPVPGGAGIGQRPAWFK